MQGYIDKRSWGIYPDAFCHPLLTILVIPFMLSGCMGMTPIDRPYEDRMLYNYTPECALPFIDTEQDARDLELAITF